MELTEQKSEKGRDRRNWLILLLLALLLSCSCVLLSTNLALYFLSRPRIVSASLLASSEADYGPDNYQTRLPAPNPSVIAIALTDEAGLQVTPIDDTEANGGGTPIALITVTPPLPPPPTTGVTPTATAVPSTRTPTPSVTLTRIPTAIPSATTPPTSTPTSTFITTATPTVVTFFTPTPTATPKPAPTNTNTPPPNNPSPSRTPTPVSATATSTFTPIPATATSTSTPVLATATSTFTPIPATPTSTFTPIPATPTSTFTPVPATPTSTFTPAPATLTPTFTPIPATATSTFTPVPPTPTPTFTPVPTREALLVVADPGSLNGTDTAVQNRLIALSFTVILADDNTIVEGDTLNRELVIISDSVNEGALGATLCDARAPTIVAKAALYDEMNMVLPGGGNNGSDANQTNVDIIDPAHPMAAGLSGSVPLLTGSNNMGWGITQPGVQQVATIAGDSSRSTIFAYPASAVITCSGLPIRRVGFPLAAGSTLTLDGWRLFDAAVNWIVP